MWVIAKCIDCGRGTTHGQSLFLTRHTTHSDLVEDYYYYDFIFFWRLLMAQTQLSRRRRRRELHSLWPNILYTNLWLWPIAATRYFNRNKWRHNVLTATTLTILICSRIKLSISTFIEQHIILHLAGGTRVIDTVVLER